MARRQTMLRWSPAVLWMVVIFVVSSLPGAELGAVSDYSFFGHLGEYAVLGVLLFVAARWRRHALTAALLAVSIASAYGVTDELHQLLTPGRASDPLDWATDTLGAILGVAIFAAAERAFRQRT